MLLGRKNKRKKPRTKRLPTLNELNRSKRGGYNQRQRQMHSSDVAEPRRFEVWYANLPLNTKTSIQGGARPVLIMSNDICNCTAQTVTVLPMTSKLKHPSLPTHVYLPRENKFGASSMILAEQITTVDKSMLDRRLTVCDEPSVIRRIEEAVSLQLGLNNNKDSAASEPQDEKGEENEKEDDQK